MNEVIGDIFDFVGDPSVDAICIFTNGILGSGGLAVVGAGTAGEAARRWGNFRKLLGTHLQLYGNVVGIVGYASSEMLGENGKPAIVVFPTKQHFMHSSLEDLVVKSSQQLSSLAGTMKWNKIVLGRPGCGTRTGRLDWNHVRELVGGFLDDRFIVVNKPEA